MIIEPWDPRIKSVSWTTDPISPLHYNTIRFIVYLHCYKKIGWQYNIDSEFMNSAGLYEAAEQIIIDMLIDEVQPLIDETYNELKKLKGGSVDIHGQPIWSLPSVVAFHNDLESPTIKVAQLNDFQEWQYWCGEVGKQFKPVPSKKMLQEKFEQTKQYLAETAIVGLHPDTGTIVQRNLKKLFPALSKTAKCPKCSTSKQSIFKTLDRMIIHLNDEHKWTREEVADWLESLDIDLGMKENV